MINLFCSEIWDESACGFDASLNLKRCQSSKEIGGGSSSSSGSNGTCHGSCGSRDAEAAAVVTPVEEDGPITFKGVRH